MVLTPCGELSVCIRISKALTSNTALSRLYAQLNGPASVGRPIARQHLDGFDSELSSDRNEIQAIRKSQIFK
jgi:hypothetical protein